MSSNNLQYFKLCTNGDLEAVKKEFEELSSEQIEAIRDEHKASCLHYAARAGHVEMLEYFISEKKVSPLLVSEVGATLLHDAAVKGKLDVIEFLLKSTSLSHSIRDANGATLLHLASKFDQTEIVDWIFKNYGTSPAKILTYNGASCLHFASATGSYAMAKLLLDAVPNFINLQMINGVTPVYLAVQENNYKVFLCLMKHGANLNLRAEDGMNVLHVACQNGNLEFVQLLIDSYELKINDSDSNGATPLHYACTNGNAALTAYLLKNGAEIVVDKFGNTPMHDCAIGGFIECARLLIANGCDVSLKDNHDMTAADLAQANGHKNFAEQIRIKLDEKTTTTASTKTDIQTPPRAASSKSNQRVRLSPDVEIINPNGINDSKNNFYQIDDDPNQRTPSRRMYKKKSTFSPNVPNRRSILVKHSSTSDEAGGNDQEKFRDEQTSPIIYTPENLSTSTPSKNEQDESPIAADQQNDLQKNKNKNKNIGLAVDDNNNGINYHRRKPEKISSATQTTLLLKQNEFLKDKFQQQQPNQSVFKIVRSRGLKCEPCLEPIPEKSGLRNPVVPILKSQLQQQDDEANNQKFWRVKSSGAIGKTTNNNQGEYDTMKRYSTGSLNYEKMMLQQANNKANNNNNNNRRSSMLFYDAENDIVSSTAIEDSFKFGSPIPAVDNTNDPRKRFSSMLYYDMSMKSPMAVNSNFNNNINNINNKNNQHHQMMMLNQMINGGSGGGGGGLARMTAATNYMNYKEAATAAAAARNLSNNNNNKLSQNAAAAAAAAEDFYNLNRFADAAGLKYNNGSNFNNNEPYYLQPPPPPPPPPALQSTALFNQSSNIYAQEQLLNRFPNRNLMPNDNINYNINSRKQQLQTGYLNELEMRMRHHDLAFKNIKNMDDAFLIDENNNNHLQDYNNNNNNNNNNNINSNYNQHQQQQQQKLLMMNQMMKNGSSSPPYLLSHQDEIRQLKSSVVAELEILKRLKAMQTYDMPEWKRELLEKKRLQQQHQQLQRVNSGGNFHHHNNNNDNQMVRPSLSHWSYK